MTVGVRRLYLLEGARAVGARAANTARCEASPRGVRSSAEA